MGKKWVKAGTIGFTLLFLTGALLPAYGNTIDAKRKELKDLRQKKQVMERRKDNMEDQMGQLVVRLDTLKEEIDALNQAIRQDKERLKIAQQDVRKATADLEEAQQDLVEQDYILGTRIRDIYEKGTVGYLEVLFESENFSDFLNRFELMKIIVEHDSMLLKSIEEKKARINDQKILLEQKRDEIETIKRAKEEKQEENKIKAEKFEDMESELRKDIGAYEEEIEKLEQEESRKAAELIRMQQRSGAAKGDGIYAWPVAGYSRVSSGYGNRMHPILKRTKFHSGLDIPAPSGTPIRAAQDGTVIYSGTMNGYGNVIILDHGAGVSTLYAHNSQNLVSVGEEVKKGSTIGKVGSTGRSTGPHVHYEIRTNGDPVNPMQYY
ncbi:MAG: peptidoglycan DD-metalloendopeptidase family protein [Clostridia bacterium]|nr:peptidoglycan DD-metalloendopeptidase family protein [Clostridia bacterium]